MQIDEGLKKDYLERLGKRWSGRGGGRGNQRVRLRLYYDDKAVS